MAYDWQLLSSHEQFQDFEGIFQSSIDITVSIGFFTQRYRIITYVSSPALVCNIGEGINISMLMLYVFCV